MKQLYTTPNIDYRRYSDTDVLLASGGDDGYVGTNLNHDQDVLWGWDK